MNLRMIRKGGCPRRDAARSKKGQCLGKDRFVVG